MVSTIEVAVPSSTQPCGTPIEFSANYDTQGELHLNLAILFTVTGQNGQNPVILDCTNPQPVTSGVIGTVTCQFTTIQSGLYTVEASLTSNGTTLFTDTSSVTVVCPITITPSKPSCGQRVTLSQSDIPPGTVVQFYYSIHGEGFVAVPDCTPITVSGDGTVQCSTTALTENTTYTILLLSKPDEITFGQADVVVTCKPYIVVPPGPHLCGTRIPITVANLPDNAANYTILAAGIGPICTGDLKPGVPPSPCVIYPVVPGTYELSGGIYTTSGVAIPFDTVKLEVTGDCLPLILEFDPVICEGDELTLTLANLPTNVDVLVDFIVPPPSPQTETTFLCRDAEPDGSTATCTTVSDLPPGEYEVIAHITPKGNITVLPSTILSTGKLTVNAAGSAACTAGDPHVLCLDGSRLDVYDPGYYRLFDNLQHTEQTPVIINAEVIRNATHEDMYQRVWVKLVEVEYLLNYTPGGVTCTAKLCRGLPIQTRYLAQPTWEQQYTSGSGEQYTFTCDKLMNTIVLRTGVKGDQRRYNGLLAGKIIRVQNLHDVQERYQTAPPLTLYSFGHSALLCGSAQPHLVTIQHKSLPVRQGVFRLLQTPELQLNVVLNSSGLLDQAVLNVTGEEPVVWQWVGDCHWSLTCSQNGYKLPVGNFYERLLQDNVLLRVQANGSISCAFKRLSVQVRGLVVGDDAVLTDLADFTELRFVEPVDYKIAPASDLYARYLGV